MRHNSDLVTVSCSDHGSRLASGLWNLFSSCHGVDHDLGSVRVHRLVLDVFLSTPKLTRQVQSDDDGVLYSLLKFLYTGKVTVRRDKLGQLLEVARASDFHMLVEVLQTMTDVSQTGNEPGAASALVDAVSDIEFKWEARHPGGKVAPIPVCDPQGVGATDCERQLVQNPDAYYSRHDPVTVKSEVFADYEGEDGKNDLGEVKLERGLPSCSSVKSGGTSGNDREGRSCARKNLNSATGSGEDVDPQRWDLQVKKIKLEERSEEEMVMVQREQEEKRSSDVHRQRGEMLEIPYRCHVCEETFACSSSLNRHWKKTHSGERLYTCRFCHQSFTCLTTMKRHSRIHTGEQPFKCLLCQESFTRPYNLRIHLQTHTGQRPYRCHVCGVSFTRRDNLRRHLEHHTEEKKYKCDLCSKPFRQRVHLKNHRRSVHRIS